MPRTSQIYLVKGEFSHILLTNLVRKASAARVSALSPVAESPEREQIESSLFFQSQYRGVQH